MKNPYFKRLEQALEGLVNQLPEQANLQESARYMLLGQGKRLRPSITIAILDDLKLLNEAHFHSALSVEILHTASLIHDDLPALDNDDYRRGKLSCHKKYSESVAILLGDYLQTWALAILSEYTLPEHLKELNRIVTSAYQSVCLGQMLDMGSSITPDFTLINQLKTSALFACSFQIAGIQANWNSEHIEKLRQVGEDFGIIFQLINDFKDCFMSPEATGRRDSSDYKNMKITSVTEFRSASEAKSFLDHQIVIWNKKFELLKLELNQPFLNLSQLIDSVLQAES